MKHLRQQKKQIGIHQSSILWKGCLINDQNIWLINSTLIIDFGQFAISFYSCQFLSWTIFKNFKKSFHTLLMTFWTFEYLCLNFLTNVISWLSNCYERHFVFCNHKCSPMKLRIEFWVFQHDYIAPFFSFLNRSHNGWEKVRQSCHLSFPSHFL